VTATSSPKRTELAAEAARLYNLGLTQKQVARRMGISRSYAGVLLTDPDGTQQRVRRATYQGACERCGGVTKSNGTSTPSRHCRDCAREIATENKRWTRETVIAAIQRFALEHGRPPISTDWLKSRAAGRDEWAPPASVVFGPTRQPFRSWADAIEAAGFPRPRVGQKIKREHRFNCLSCGLEVVHRGSAPRVYLCADCVAAKQRAYREENRDEIAAKQRAYREENRDEIAAKKRAYYEENRDEIAAKQRAYREENRDEIAAKKRAYYEENRDEIAAKQRAYYEENRDEIAAKQIEEGRVCAECGVRLRKTDEPGPRVCGFCRDEAAT
jgi:hypothetical protein